MNKKVLILSGSPRRGGNSDTLCDAFMKGATEAGNFVEKIFIRDKKINYCYACDACRNTGICIHKDDMAEILEKMDAADVLVMATPVYFFSIDAQMKTVIDRTYARCAKFGSKELYYIMTAADSFDEVMDGTLACFRGFAACLNNAKEKGVLCGKGVLEAGKVQNTPYMQEAYEMGKNV